MTSVGGESEIQHFAAQKSRERICALVRKTRIGAYNLQLL